MRIDEGEVFTIQFAPSEGEKVTCLRQADARGGQATLLRGESCTQGHAQPEASQEIRSDLD